MATKYRLKKKVKRDLILFIFILIVVGIGVYFGIKKYNEYLYQQTYEYKLVQHGYTLEEEHILENKLTKENLSDLLNRPYSEFIMPFVNCKYFLYKNLDGYLNNVITQDDFFHYHGIEGYDFDNIIAIENAHANSEPGSLNLFSDLNDNYAVLANKYYKLPDNYLPDDLVSINIKYYYGDAKKIRSEVYDAFLNMWNAAYEEGIYLIIIDAFRTHQDQVEAYQYYEKLKGSEYADTIAARPGYSEHQTGLAFDIYSKENTSSQTFKDSESYRWLVNNAYKYGFILRYPEGKEKITGYRFESWHYRYVGVELARKVYESGLTYDEYYAFYLDK